MITNGTRAAWWRKAVFSHPRDYARLRCTWSGTRHLGGLGDMCTGLVLLSHALGHTQAVRDLSSGLLSPKCGLCSYGCCLAPYPVKTLTSQPTQAPQLDCYWVELISGCKEMSVPGGS